MSVVADWTDRLKGAGTHQGRWALGLESMGFRIARELLPSITNTTIRARYYSFLCWAYWTFAEHMRSLGRADATYAEQRAWRMRLENAMRTATVLDPDYHHGLIGRNSAIPLRPGEPYPIGENIEISAWQPEYYKPSWLGFGFGQLRGDIVVVHPDRGVPLAKAVDERIRRDDADGSLYRALTSDDPAIPPQVIEALGDAFSLRALREDDGREQALLVDRLFNLTRRENPDPLTRVDWTRSISLTLLLDMVGAGNGEYTDANTAHYVFGTARFRSGDRYTPPPSLQETYAKWERYQEREQEKIAFYALWHETLMAIRSGRGAGLSGAAVVQWIVDRAAESEAVIQQLPDGALDRPVSESLAHLQESLDAGAADLLIQVLTDNILDFTRRNKAGGATVVLLLLAQKWAAMASDLPASVASVHTTAAASELPLPLVSREILGRSHHTLRQLLRHVTERWVLSQSLRVALEKWSSNQDRFFIARDAQGYRIVRGQNTGAYLTYDPPRIDSSLHILNDLRLVESEGQGLVLTSDGERIREEGIRFHGERLNQDTR
jgi:hypothetical protein